MNLKERIDVFAALGSYLKFESDFFHSQLFSSLKFSSKEELYQKVCEQNPWFTPENVAFALEQVSNNLTHENISKWIEPYIELNYNFKSVKVGVVMAGNIPLVGFHDFLSVLITGNKIIVKTASKDDILIRFVADFLVSFDNRWKEFIEFENSGLKNFDAVIATGSNNSSRYFEYYFKDYPFIIRKNRSSIAVLSGNETNEQLSNLADDIFIYFGLGCRNVSHVYVPQNFKIENLIHSLSKYSKIIHHNKFANNIEYNRAIFLVNNVKFFDAEFILLLENEEIASPIGVLYFSYYHSIESMTEFVKINEQKIQCVVSDMSISEKIIKFGHSQKPLLCDYADGIDTIKFLSGLRTQH